MFRWELTHIKFAPSLVKLSLFPQYKLQKNFGYSDNYVIKSLETSLVDLRAKRMDLPPPGADNELPKCEMGQFIEPSIEKKLGLRTACFTNSERNVTEFVISRNEENGNDVDALDENQDDAISNFNTGMSHEVVGGKRFSGESCSSAALFIDQSFSPLSSLMFACSSGFSRVTSR